MKKSKLIFLALSCVLLWSCTQPTNVTTQNDTVIKLDTPKVEGIAYPGVNYIYWSNVQNAFNGYDLRVYRKDNGKDILIESESRHFPKNTTYYKDTNISDGEEKRYEVVASGDQQWRAAYYSESSAGDVTLNSIVPSLSTKPLNFEKYEKDYNASDVDNSKNSLSSSNISLVNDEKFGFFRVSFPVKPYLKYKVYADYGNSYELYGVHDILLEEYSDISAPLNSIATISGVADHSGTYKITIEVTSVNGKYIGFNEIESSSTIEFETLELLDDTFEYEISFNENKERQITWNINKYKDGSYVPSSDYKFYISEFGKRNYSEYNGTISLAPDEITNTSKKYTMPFIFPDESKMYSFIVIISKNNKLAFSEEIKGDIYEQQITPADLSLVGQYVSENTIKLSWNPAKYTNDSVVPLSQYTVYAKEKGADDSEYKQVETEIKYTRNNSGIYAEIEVENNKVSYDFLISYTENNSIYQSKIRVSVYNKDTVQILNNIINSNWIVADDDELANDLEVIVTLDSKQKLSSIKYATASSEEEAMLLAESGTELEFESGYTYYVFTLNNVGNTTNCYTAIDVVVSEDGKVDNYVTKAYEYLAISKFVTVSDIRFNCKDNDSLSNDVYFNISADNIDQKITVQYAVAKNQSTAMKLLETSKVNTLVTNLSGYKFYEFDSKQYKALKDIAIGNYIAVKVIVSETGKLDWAYNKVSDNCSNVEENITAPANIFVDWVAMDSEEAIANDLYAIIETGIDQRISRISYATATKQEYDANPSILNNRLNSKDIVNVELLDIKELYRKEDRIVYSLTLKDFDVGTYLILKVTTSEDGKTDNVENESTINPVTETIVDILDTAQPLISDDLKFESKDYDSDYNDVDLNDIDVRIDLTQSIESITYVYAGTIALAEELLVSTSNEVKTVQVPEGYTLETDVQGGVAKLTKCYNIGETISNVPAGNYLVLAIKVSQPGYNSVIKYVPTKSYKDWYADYNVPAVSTQRPITAPVTFEVNDSQNYEYVKLVLQETYPYDSQSCYEYTLQRTFEKYYSEGNPIWEIIDLESTIYDTGLPYEYYYTDIPVGNYVYRLTKTRTATGESAVYDRKVTVGYNVEAPSITIGSYENKNIVINSTEKIDKRYDDIEKYDYTLKYTLKNELKEIVNYIEVKWDTANNINDDYYSYYTLSDAVINNLDEIISENDLLVDSDSLYVDVQLTKTRKIATYEYDTKSTGLYVSKGIAAIVNNSIPTLELLRIGNDFYVTSGFDTYTWYVNGTEFTDAKDSTWTNIDSAVFNYGQNTVTVIAKKGKISTSASVEYIKNR